MTTLAEPAAVPALPTAQRARTLHGHPTDVVVQIFADRILVLVTQLGRIGALIQVSPPPAPAFASLPAPPPVARTGGTRVRPPPPPPHPSTLLTPLFGAAPSPHIAALHDLYALHIGALVFHRLGAAASDAAAGPGETPLRPVVLGIGLRRTPSPAAPPGDLDDSSAEVTDAERTTFEHVLDMVADCLGS